jgi:predicted restriction endonuclease
MSTPEGIAAVVNGLALCAIHHLAFDRNLLGIDPGAVVHIADRRQPPGQTRKSGHVENLERRELLFKVMPLPVPASMRHER